ncbi:MTH1187 family thiamine-binding protein [Agromyces sp. NPDC058064]|uniref:thiamine-binding protein n=1 Tax=Agromyces sp. NPDC058064 TaxID=3346322 RepID=UPI0036D88153
MRASFGSTRKTAGGGDVFPLTAPLSRSCERRAEGANASAFEGEWDEVFDVVRRATEAVGEYGSRVSLVLKADLRPGYSGELDAKIDRLETAIGEADAGAGDTRD